jgi:hypothetical protein
MNQKVIERIIIVLLLSGAFLCTLYPIWDPDSFWHIAFGNYIYDNKALVSQEPFGFTNEGQSVGDLSWLPHLAFYCIFKFAGYRGLEILVSLTALLTIIFMIMAAKKDFLSLVSFALYFSLFYNIFRSRIRLRPEGLSVLLFAALIYLLFLYRNDRLKFPPAFALLFLIWTQIHPSWIYGLILIPPFVLEKHWLKFNKATLKDAFYLFILPCCVLFINPYGYKPVIFPFTSFIEMRNTPTYIKEWGKLPLNQMTIPFIALVVLILLFNLYMLVKKKDSFLPSAICLLQLIFFLSWTRYMTFAFIALAPFTTCFICFLISKLKKFSSVFALISILVLLFPLFSAIKYRPTEKVLAPKYPEAEAGFLLSNSINGNLLHMYETGGFLEFKLYPRSKVFFDGRYFDFLPYYKEYVRAMFSIPEFVKMADKYNCEIGVFPYSDAYFNDPRTGMKRNSLALMFPREKWAPVFYGPYGAVFLRRVPKFEKAIGLYEFKTLYPYDRDFTIYQLKTGAAEKEELDKEIKRAYETKAKFLTEAGK